jgi:uncharacterized membrane protein YqjE
MDQPRPTLVELADASKRVAQRTLDIGANRLELLIVELHEERERLLQSIQLALGAAALALLAGVALTLGIMVLLWDHSPVVALAILTALYGSGAAFLYARFNGLQRDCQMFTATLDQLRKDRDCLAHNLR